MKENKNEPGYTGEDSVYPQQLTLLDGDTIIVPGLTKLELISAMCLQGVLSYPFRQSQPYENISERVSSAIEHAKELLKQLEAEND